MALAWRGSVLCKQLGIGLHLLPSFVVDAELPITVDSPFRTGYSYRGTHGDAGPRPPLTAPVWRSLPIGHRLAAKSSPLLDCLPHRAAWRICRAVHVRKETAALPPQRDEPKHGRDRGNYCGHSANNGPARLSLAFSLGDEPLEVIQEGRAYAHSLGMGSLEIPPKLTKARCIQRSVGDRSIECGPVVVLTQRGLSPSGHAGRWCRGGTGNGKIFLPRFFSGA